MIYAKVDVKLRDHERAHRAGAAMATWTWGLLYSREQESDGFIADVALRGSWVGEREAKRHAAQLVLVGLWEKADDGWRICRYGDKNETRATIALRRAEAAERMQRVRANRQRTPSEPPTNVRSENSTAVPGSGSVLVEERNKGSEIPSARARANPGDDPPDWWPGVLATISQRGVDLDPGLSWIRYAGHRAGKNRPATREDALYWLGTVMVPEAIETRKKDSARKERDAKFDAEREKERTPAKAPYHAIAPKNHDDETRAPPEVAKTALGNLAKMFQPPGGTK